MSVSRHQIKSGVDSKFLIIKPLGLFTPNAGQHFRDEQRRRRSQYDRGTRLAALEEYDYDSQIQQQGLYHPQ